MKEQKRYQLREFTRHHYQRLLTAKSTIKQMKEKNKNSVNTSKTITPIQIYERNRINLNLCNKLNEIYKKPSEFIPKKEESRAKPSHSARVRVLNASKNEESIHEENVQMLNRMINIKSTFKQNWKSREKKLKRYGNITRKTFDFDGDSTYRAYRELMMSEHSRAGCRKRPKSSKKQQSALSQRSKGQKNHETQYQNYQNKYNRSESLQQLGKNQKNFKLKSQQDTLNI